MSIVSVKDLLESGVHFGHRVSRWNPKMSPYIYGKRNLIHIIDLKETIRGLIRAYNFLFKLTSEGGEVLFVGTKRQAKNVVLEEATRSGMHYVTERWLGGTLTNFSTIRERLKRLEDLQSLEETGAIEAYSKKVQSSLMREKRKISRNLSGITSMTKLPDALVVVDQGREKNALLEADKLGIPVICILDTNCDPDLVDICIPGNDDAMRSIQVLLMKLTESILAGAQVYKESGAAQEKAKREEEAKRERSSGGDRDRNKRQDNRRPRRGGDNRRDGQKSGGHPAANRSNDRRGGVAGEKKGPPSNTDKKPEDAKKAPSPAKAEEPKVAAKAEEKKTEDKK